MSGVLNEIIDVNQTAYVKGRAVADNLMVNLRHLMFMKDHCAEEMVDAVLFNAGSGKVL